MSENLGNTYEDRPKKPKKSGTDTGNKESTGTSAGENNNEMQKELNAVDKAMILEKTLLQQKRMGNMKKLEDALRKQDQDEANKLLQQLEGGYTSGTSTGNSDTSSQSGNEEMWNGNSVGDLPSDKKDITIGVLGGKQRAREEYTSTTDSDNINESGTQTGIDNARPSGGTPDIPRK